MTSTGSRRLKRVSEVTEKFKQWSEFNETHLKRQLSIISRHVTNMQKWVDLMNKYPSFPKEETEAVVAMRNELGNLFDEAHELFEDMMGDATKFIKVLSLLEKEIEKLPNDDKN